MRKSIITGAAVALSLAFAGTAQADTVQTINDGDWATTSPTVFKTPEGVHFGTFANGGAAGGSLRYLGANGMEIKDVDNFSYTFNYRQAGNAVGAAPYMRVFTDANNNGTYDGNGIDNSIVLDASQCGSPANPAGLPVAQGVNLTLGTANAKFRYNDDPCGINAVQKTWGDIVTEHGTEKIVMVMVTHGYSQGTDVSSMLKNIKLNDDTFDFTGAPANGQDGSNGTNGTNATNGVNGKDGAAGPAGKDGVTTVVHVQGPVAGATKRTLHVRKIAGMRFVGAKATLKGKKLSVKGRTIKVNLTGKSVGEYIVRITAKYKVGGKTYKVHSLRSLSIIRK